MGSQAFSRCRLNWIHDQNAIAQVKGEAAAGLCNRCCRSCLENPFYQRVFKSLEGLSRRCEKLRSHFFA